MVSKSRKVTHNIAEAMGGREETNHVLKQSVDDMREQVNVNSVFDRSVISRSSGRTTGTTSEFFEKKVDFGKFKNTEVVNTLLGASKNPIDENISKE